MSDEGPLYDDPFLWFDAWWKEARTQDVDEPTAVSLATADAEGRPSVRIVLLKHHDARGFVVYTNLESRKGEELRANPHAALCFYWDRLGRQVRARGRTEQVSDEEADAYWQRRARTSRLGALASAQSRPLQSRQALLDRVATLDEEYPGDVPRPEHWTGVRIVPDEVEFWSRGEFRLHDRFRFVRQGDRWTVTRLHP